MELIEPRAAGVISFSTVLGLACSDASSGCCIKGSFMKTKTRRVTSEQSWWGGSGALVYEAHWPQSARGARSLPPAPGAPGPLVTPAQRTWYQPPQPEHVIQSARRCAVSLKAPRAQLQVQSSTSRVQQAQASPGPPPYAPPRQGMRRRSWVVYPGAELGGAGLGMVVGQKH
ncbi:Palmdelphin [Frankliniella fusca]|uniref:Palmdelphin n=1 Tax=Frankliniella fusca TaxID=407009 RepID=A0AAE1I2N9_9NEOP|nr:Palmdelphin [Frankliniella fusca]